MISALLDRTLEQIRPLFDANLAAALAERWAAQNRRPGSLGRLENLVVHYGLVKGTAQPVAARKGLVVFAADHGIVHEGVTTEAQDETRRQARQFLQGTSPAGVLCRSCQIDTLLVNAGMAAGSETGTIDRQISQGSQSMAKTAALTAEEAGAALETGIQLAEELALRFEVVGLGQLGAGGSCAASAMLSAFSGRDAADCTVREPGLDDAVYNRRVQVLRTAVNLHQAEAINPFGVLRTLGGADIAAMTGFILGAAARRLPVIMDGFTAGAAALAARAMAPDSLDALIFPHVDPSRPHLYMLRFLSVEPLLDLSIHEEEGFGAALGLEMLDLALHQYAEVQGPA